MNSLQHAFRTDDLIFAIHQDASRFSAFIKGFLSAALFTTEDETLFTCLDWRDCDEEAHEIAHSVAQIMYNFISVYDIKFPNQNSHFQFGLDTFMSARRTGVNFDDRGHYQHISIELKNFVQSRLAKIQNAETWYDEDDEKFHIRIHQRDF